MPSKIVVLLANALRALVVDEAERGNVPMSFVVERALANHFGRRELIRPRVVGRPRKEKGKKR